MNDTLSVKLIKIHEALTSHHIPHAFGGAIAFVYYGAPRYTHDIDINVELPPEQYKPVFEAIAALFPVVDEQATIDRLLARSQIRLQWDDTPVDLFFANVPFHESVAQRVHNVVYASTTIPIISAEDLIILKAAFNRAKDWLDITSMFEIQGQRLDASYVRRWLSEFYNPEDGPYVQIERLIGQYVQPDELNRTD